jgi:DNA topoisomerase I
MALLYENLCAADEADLYYVTDEIPGISRRRRGKGFSYHAPDGSTITDPGERARIEAIAIPPAWTDVWICPVPDGHILASGRDDRGRKQYRYHPRWREVRDTDKYDRLAAFGAMLPDLRRDLDGDLRRRGLPREKVLALVVQLLDATLIRVGNDAYAEANDSFGLTTLRPEHVEVSSTTVEFDFVGKGGVERQLAIRDQRLARIVKQCHELRGQDLFSYQGEDGEIVDVGSTDVNGYLREIAGADITAKHFRTWGGTVTAAETLLELTPPDTGSGTGTGRDADADVLAAIDAAADTLGNTRAVCRSCYVHPAVPDAYRDGTLHEAWRSSRETAWFRRAERTVLKVLEQQPG